MTIDTDKEKKKLESIENIAPLKESVSELRRLYDRINADYNNLRTRLFTLLGGNLVLGTYLFSGNSFFPAENYGKIFFFGGVGILIFTVVLLLYGCSSAPWAAPLDIDNPDNWDGRYQSHQEFLHYLKKDYLQSLNLCFEQHSKKVNILDWSIKLSFLGGIILLVLKLAQ